MNSCRNFLSQKSISKTYKFFLLLLFLNAVTARASTIVWNGPASTNTTYLWSADTNWVGGAVPTSIDDVKFFDAGAVPGISNINNTVDTSFGGTIGSLQYGNTNNFNSTLIPNGIILTLTGTNGIMAGTLTDNGNTQIVSATVTGPGTLAVNNSVANVLVDQGRSANGNSTQRAILDLSGLGTFSATINRIGVGTATLGGANNAQNSTGTLKLGQTNIISTAFIGTPITLNNVATPTNAIEIGSDNGNAGGVDFFYLGQTNVFYIDSLGVGSLKTTATMLFNPGLINPTAYFRGIGGNSSRIRFWTVGDMASSGSSSAAATGTNDFTGGTVDILVDTLSLGRDRQGGNTGAGITRGTLTFSSGIIDVNNLYAGNQQFTASANSNPLSGIINIIGASATLRVNTNLVLGRTTTTSQAAISSGGTLNVTNGTVLANAISVGAVSLNNFINLTNATLIVSNSLASTATPLTNFYTANSLLGLTVGDATTRAAFGKLTTGGTTNLIQLNSVVVFASYPVTINLIKYFGSILGSGFNFGLTNVPLSAPGAYLSNNVANSSVDLVLPEDPRPIITNQPAGYSGSPGDTVNFSVGINSNSVAPLSYQWYLGTTPLTDGTTVNGSTISGSTNSLLIISGAQPGDNGNYSVFITNNFGSVTSFVAVLTISAGNVMPSITGPNNQTVIQGNNANFTVTVSGVPAPTLQWQRNGTNISGATSASLTVSNVQYVIDNGAVYSLIASNAAGEATNSATLTVIVPPAIISQPVNAIVTNTQSASFTVGATGVPNPNYQWYKNNSAINNATNATFSIASTSSGDSANYYVNIFNTAGSTNSAVISLTVNSTMTFVSLAPTNNATAICYDTPLYITFNQTPTLRTSGKIQIYNLTNSTTPVDILDLSQNSTLNVPYAVNVQPRNIGGDTFNSFPVIITGNTAAIYPHGGVLTSNQIYYVTIDDGVFADSTGAYFVGISATNTWQFTTKIGGPLNPTNLLVAADGSGDFLTVQGAVDSVPANNTVNTFINVNNGVYTEIVDVKSKNNLKFHGQSRSAIINYPNNNNVNPSGAPLRAMFVLNGNDCTFDNITISNSTPHGGSQAEAIDVEGTRAILYNIELDSYQDTLLVHSAGKLLYVQDSLIQGDTDFNWGYGTEFYTNCELRVLTTGGHVTQPRSPLGSNGFSFVNCKITAGSGSVTSADLGRSISTPTTPSEVIFSDCLMGDFITGYNSDAGTNFWDYADSNLTATATKTLTNSTHLVGTEPILASALNATNWLYGWQPQVAPAILNNPTNLTVYAGSSATFAVIATGISSPAYQWLKNSTNLSGATNATYTIASAQSTDAGNYSVIVSNSVSSIISTNVMLTVLTPTPPALGNVTLLNNGNIQFTFNGMANLNYRIWATTNLLLSPVTNTWTLLTNNIFIGNPTTFTDPTTNLPQRFYIITVP